MEEKGRTCMGVVQEVEEGHPDGLSHSLLRTR